MCGMVSAVRAIWQISKIGELFALKIVLKRTPFEGRLLYMVGIGMESSATSLIFL